MAARNSRREVKRKVQQAKQAEADKNAGQPSLMPEPKKQPRLPAAVVPVTELVSFSPTRFARYEKLWEKIGKLRGVSLGRANKAESLLEMMSYFVDEKSNRLDSQASESKPRPLAAPAQIHIHQCPDCRKATVQTSRRELEIFPAELEQAQCDCQISQSGKRNTASVPPGIKQLVLARDRHRCQRKCLTENSF